MTACPVVYGIIPARYASARFPGKPLAPIHGKPMFLHVYERACRCPRLAQVVLATDDQRIFDAARKHDVPVVMTDGNHPSGTDRVLETAEILKVPAEAVVLNIQGDEPALEPAMLEALIEPFSDPAVRVATLARKIDAGEARNPDQVKVVFDRAAKALYFSRRVIPYPAECPSIQYYGHIGLYAFRMEALKLFVRLGRGVLEKAEMLEQLRLLENRIPIHVVETLFHSIGVDRPEHIPLVSRLLSH